MEKNIQRNPFFLPSGFEEQEKINILEAKGENKKRLDKIKERKRHETKRIHHIKAGHVLKAGIRFKQRRAPKSDQIQYGFNLAKWWSEQHA